jgi:hypothetical protein
MRRINLAFVVFLGLWIASCASIPRYTVSPVNPLDTQFILSPSSLALRVYDPSTAQQWDRTYSFCVQRENAIAKEMSQREDNLSARKNWFLTIGGLATLANTIYSGIKENPEKSVTIPLIAVSGTSLLSLLPSIAEDGELNVLREKSANLKVVKIQATKVLSELEKKFLSIANDQLQLRDLRTQVPPDSDKIAKLGNIINAEQVAIIDVIGTLKSTLVEWQDAAK